jgi:hypothetical protein
MMILNRFIHVKTRHYLGILTLMLCTSFVSAQSKPKNQPKYDRKPLHFGFSLGINTYDFHIQEIEDLASLDGYYSVETNASPGYTIRIISNLRLGDFWDLRFCPGFAATERELIFDLENPNNRDRRELVSKTIESSFIEMPLLLKWKSERINNYRLYVLGGTKYNLDLSSNEDVVDDRIFKLRQNDLFYEFGVGIDIYFEFFKFSPQIVGSWGFANMKVEDGTFFVDGLNRLESRAILINFTFE